MVIKNLQSLFIGSEELCNRAYMFHVLSFFFFSLLCKKNDKGWMSVLCVFFTVNRTAQFSNNERKLLFTLAFPLTAESLTGIK